MLACLFLLACSGSTAETPPGGDDGSADGGAGAGSDAGSDGDDGSTGDTDDWDELDLYGDWAAERIPAPEFTATNLDGAARDREDLLGHPTVMWFYPAAATAG